MSVKNIFSLYIHIPFCIKKCLFCSFAVAIAQSHRVDEYCAALKKEAEQYKGRDISTIYFGGGTPSFLSKAQLSDLINFFRSHFNVASHAEWTLEANPDTIDADKAKTLLDLGINRVSLGVQSFNDAYLKFLGRTHDAQRALAVVDQLHHVGFNNINVDLMYGFPGQTREELAQDINRIIALKPQHVSIYTLTIEPNSRFYARQMKLDQEEKLADDYQFVTDALNQAGIRQYEVSNFAQPGFESRHNQGYWTGQSYIGLGMGAHSYVGKRRFWNHDTLNAYLTAIQSRGGAEEGQEELLPQTILGERLVFGLRMNKGVDVSIIEKDTQCVLRPQQHQVIADLTSQGFLQHNNGRLTVTDCGRLVLDELSSRLL